MIARALLISLAICAASATLEGIFAGRGVKNRLGELRLPPYSPPFAVWIGIGLLYYAACFVVLYQLLKHGLRSPSGRLAFMLALIIMSVNAFWNFLFFRRKDVRASFFVSLPYVILALTLASVLFPLNSIAAWAFLPYVVYLGYATWWGYRLWQLNDRRGAA